ncbi:MAG: glutathione S-transferase family protein [Alphaproteobacteria bacterium]
MTITVYGGGLSPYTRKVMVFLAEKGVDFEHEPLSPFNAPGWFAEISPLGKMPVMRDTDVGEVATVPDSSAICAYLERKHPLPALYPVDAFEYARALWYEEHADTALAEAIGGIFYATVVLPRIGREPDEAMAARAREKLVPKAFAYMDREVADKEFLVGDAFSIADIAVAAQLANHSLAGETMDARTYPNLAAYADRLHARPSFAPLLEAARTALGG